MYKKLTLVFSHTTTTSSNLIVNIAKMSGDLVATAPHTNCPTLLDVPAAATVHYGAGHSPML
jgi:hypothetical protein